MAWAIQSALIKQLGYSVIFLGPVFSASSTHLPQQGPCLCIPRCPKMSVSTQHPRRGRWLGFWEAWIWVREEDMSHQLCDPSASWWGLLHPRLHSVHLTGVRISMSEGMSRLGVTLLKVIWLGVAQRFKFSSSKINTKLLTFPRSHILFLFHKLG